MHNCAKKNHTSDISDQFIVSNHPVFDPIRITNPIILNFTFANIDPVVPNTLKNVKIII